MKEKNTKRVLCLVLSLVIAISILTISAVTVFAGGENEQDITEVSTFGELLAAVNADKTYIKLMNNIEDIVPYDELPSLHKLVFDGGKNYVLDLNYYMLEVINHINEYFSGDFPMISVSGDSHLEIKNGSLCFDNYAAKGSNRKARGVVHVSDTSTLVATDVNMTNRYAGTVVSATANAGVTLNGGEYIVQNGFAIYIDRQASLTLDGCVYIRTVVGDSANTQYVDGYGALYSESTGKLTINYATFQSGIQVHSSQIGEFSTANHEVTIDGTVLSEDIFVGTVSEAKNQNKEYYWYSYHHNSLERVNDNSFCLIVTVISYDKKYPIDIQNGTATVNGAVVTEASYGQTVNIVADTAEDGMEFVRWDTNGVVLTDYYNASTTFTMPPARVYTAAYYGKESVKSVSVTVDTPVAGQKISDVVVTADGGVTVQTIEWYENLVKMDENDIFIPGNTYAIKILVYPPDENIFDTALTATANGKSAQATANKQYAYIDFEVVKLADNPFPVVYNTSTAQLGIGGRLELDTTLMASQSALFKEAYDAGTVEYQWYKNGEIVEWAITPAYYFGAEDVGSSFYVIVTVGNQAAWGHTVNVSNFIYQIYLNAGEIIPGEKAPQMSSVTPGVSINMDSLIIAEGYGMPALDIQKAILIPGKSYVMIGRLIAVGDANIPNGANVYVNDEMMPEVTDGIGQFFYEFEVPEADYPVYYKANGEIGIGVTLTVDIEKMCNESGTFKNAYEAANDTYQTVFYQWYKNGEKINGATNVSYTVKSTDKDSYINCKVTLVDGKYGIGEQFTISNVITVLNVSMPFPKNGQTRIEKSEISADGVNIIGIMWWPEETGAEMQGNDTFVEGTVYEFYLQVEAKDTFLLDFNGDMTIAYVYGEQTNSAGSVPNQGKAYYMGKVSAIHQHQYSDEVWAFNGDYHWQPCIVPGCLVPHEEEHEIGFHYGTEATCQSKGKCSVCGFEYYGEHDIAAPNYVYIDDMKCGSYCATEGCDYLSEWSYHTGGIFDCQHKAICEICHHEYGKLGDHIPKSEWKSDANSHWHECKNCTDQQLEKSAHVDTDVNGKCDVCDHQTTGAAPDNPDDPNQPQNPDDPIDDGGLGAGAIAAIVIGSVAAVGICVFVLFRFVIKKKRL